MTIPGLDAGPHACAAGRNLVRADDPDWDRPCTAEGTSVLVLGLDEEEGGGSMILRMCQHHVAQIPADKVDPRAN